MLTLTVFRGDRIVQELDLEGHEILIGRSSDNHVVLPDDGKGISRVHAMLKVEDGSYVLYDRNSQNGTYVEGKKIKREVLQPGQSFVIGPYRVVVNVENAADVDPGAAVTMLRAPSDPIPAPAAAPNASATPPPSPSSSSSGIREGTAERLGRPRTQTQRSLPPPGDPTAGTGAWLQRQPRALLYGAGAAIVVVVAALSTWLLWPDQTVPTVATASTTTTSIPVTTTVTPIQPPDQRLVDARAAIEAAEQSIVPAEGNKITAAQFLAAAAELDSIIAKYLQPILGENASNAEAIDLQARATERATYARQQVTRLQPSLKTTTSVSCGDPDGVVRRAGESCTAYETRNADAKRAYDRGRSLVNQGNWAEALQVWTALAEREPDFRDVTTYRRLAENTIEKMRGAALAEGERLQDSGLKQIAAGRLPEAAPDLVSAGDAFERARQLGAPGADKLVAENQQHRRQVAQRALSTARSYANTGDIAQARRLFQTVIMLLPPGDPLSVQAAADLKKVESDRR